jgi:acylphosphatase
MAEQRIRRRVVVNGRVQGVFFRDCTRREAERNSVAGWVTNRPDGAVEAVLEGPADAVEHVLSFIRDGPRHARVEDLEVIEEQPEGLKGFRVR